MLLLLIALSFGLLEDGKDNVCRSLLDVSRFYNHVEILRANGNYPILRNLQRPESITGCISEHLIIWDIV